MSRSDEADDPRRRILVRALTLGLFSVGAGARPARADELFGRAPTKLPEGQSIYKITGSAAVNGVPATLETRIRATDTVTTGENSEIIFVVGANSMILRSNSHLELSGAAPHDKEKESFVIAGLRILQGAILSVSRSSGMSLRTPAATIGIRGTGFYTEADPEQTYFCTCYGLSETTSLAEPSAKETVQATHHDRPLYILSEPKGNAPIRNAPFKNHTDAELAVIEALVGRTPPWVFPGDLYNAPRRDY